MGQLIHDLAGGVYRWRQIMPVALSLNEVGPESPETQAGRELVAADKVSLARDERTPSGLRVLVGKRLFDLRRDLFERDILARLDLADHHQRRPEAAFDRRAHFVDRQREGCVRHGRIEDRGFRHEAEIGVRCAEPALLGNVFKRRAACQASARGLRLLDSGEHQLVHLALLRRAEPVLALFEQLFRVLVGNLCPLADLLRRDRDEGNLAVFGRAKLDLVVLEISGERLGRGRVDGARLGRVELDEFDRALLVLVAAQCVDHGFGRLEASADRAGDLPPQRYLALLGDIARLTPARKQDNLSGGIVQGKNLAGLKTARPLDRLAHHGRPLERLLKAGLAYTGLVQQHIAHAVRTGDEAVPFVGVKPFDLAADGQGVVVLHAALSNRLSASSDFGQL